MEFAVLLINNFWMLYSQFYSMETRLVWPESARNLAKYSFQRSVAWEGMGIFFYSLVLISFCGFIETKWSQKIALIQKILRISSWAAFLIIESKSFEQTRYFDDFYETSARNTYLTLAVYIFRFYNFRLNQWILITSSAKLANLSICILWKESQLH